ncbi:hypothetical protein N7535_004656 [Penicillium sp. DV-2018c]|nr:hypothetical protein N7461_008236 [Penicillium sp. DV-2018c]KAJ5570996.1 hypothetical protein N7535_004656 [Penicillium sp. DV-2018c]
MSPTSVHGTRIRDIIDHRTRTRRGKPLTPAQEGLLRKLYERELPFVPKGAPPVKPFWVNLASQFHKHSGREYSWLSVKRRVAGWHQGSLQDERSANVSRASVNSDESPITPDGTEAAVCDLQRPQVQPHITWPALSPNGSSQPQDHPDLDQSELGRSPRIPDEMQPSCLLSAMAPQSVAEAKFHRKSLSRSRSRSPDQVSCYMRPHRSLSAKRRPASVVRRKCPRLASASHNAAVSGPKPAWDVAVDLDSASTANPCGIGHFNDLLEEDEACDIVRGSTRLAPEDGSTCNGLLESSDLSDPGGLPVTPVVIPRRGAGPKK